MEGFLFRANSGDVNQPSSMSQKKGGGGEITLVSYFLSRQLFKKMFEPSIQLLLFVHNFIISLKGKWSIHSILQMHFKMAL